MCRILRHGTVAAASVIGLTGVLLMAAPASAAPIPESSLAWSIESSDEQGEPVTGVLTEPAAASRASATGTSTG